MSSNCLTRTLYVSGVKVDVRTHDVLIPAYLLNDRLSRASDVRVVLDSKSAREPGCIHIKDLKALGFAGFCRVTPKMAPGFLRSRPAPVMVDRPNGDPLTQEDIDRITSMGGAVFFEQRSYAESGRDGFTSVLDSRRSQGKAGASLSPDYKSIPGTKAEQTMLSCSGLSQKQVSDALYSCVAKKQVLPALEVYLKTALATHAARELQDRIESAKDTTVTPVKVRKGLAMVSLPESVTRNINAVLTVASMFSLVSDSALQSFFNANPVLKQPSISHTDLLRHSLDRTTIPAYRTIAPVALAASVDKKLQARLSNSWDTYLSSLDRDRSDTTYVKAAIEQLAMDYSNLGVTSPELVFDSLSNGIYPLDVSVLTRHLGYRLPVRKWSPQAVKAARRYADLYHNNPSFRLSQRPVISGLI